MASINNSSLLDTEVLKTLNNCQVSIIYTEWNEPIIQELRNGVHRILGEFDCKIKHELSVPGCFELPFACNRLAQLPLDAPEAIIALGAVIRGGTPHFEYVSQAVTSGISHINATGGVPVIFGILTLDNEAQAWERLGGVHGHKGEEAAITALKMIALRRQL